MTNSKRIFIFHDKLYESSELEIKNIINLKKNDDESVKKILESFDKVANLNELCIENKRDMSHDDFLKIIAKYENVQIFRYDHYCVFVNISKHIILKHNVLTLFKISFLESKKYIMYNVPNYIEEINCVLGEFYFDNLPVGLKKIRIVDYDNKTDYKYFYDDEKHNNKTNHKNTKYCEQRYEYKSFNYPYFYDYDYDGFYDRLEYDYDHLVDAAIAKRELIEKYFIKIPFGCKVVDKNDFEIQL